jgi:hypothetical protein
LEANREQIVYITPLAGRSLSVFLIGWYKNGSEENRDANREVKSSTTGLMSTIRVVWYWVETVRI